MLYPKRFYNRRGSVVLSLREDCYRNNKSTKAHWIG